VQADKVFLYAPETEATLSYGQLAKEAHHFSTWLEEQKISAHGHVGLYMHNGRQTSTIFLAAMACGRVITPLNLLAPTNQLAWVLDHSDVEILFYSPDKKQSLFAALENTKRKFQLVELDPDEAQGPFMKSAAGTLPIVKSTQPALLMYTSGTTGTPKGVLLTHANLLHAARSMASWHSLTEADIVLSS
jgi:long-chain acyl-CoA synthetase